MVAAGLRFGARREHRDRVIAVIAVVSWVDYPLRTESLAVLFAFFLAAMTPSSRARSA